MYKLVITIDYFITILLLGSARNRTNYLSSIEVNFEYFSYLYETRICRTNYAKIYVISDNLLCICQIIFLAKMAISCFFHISVTAGFVFIKIQRTICLQVILASCNLNDIYRLLFIENILLTSCR